MKLHHTTRGDRYLRILGIILLAALIAAVLPVLYLGFFAHPASDDYSFGRHNVHALRHGTSLLYSIGYTVKRFYFGWQGTFSAVALMSLEPSIFGEQFYALTPFVMLGALSLGTTKLLDTLLRRMLCQSRSLVLCATSLLLLLSLELLPDPHEGFYWWNGAMFYTFFYSIMLLFLDQLLVLSMTASGAARIRVWVRVCLLGLLLGGGNYVSALLSLEICVLFCGYCLRKRRNLLPYAAVTWLLISAAFLISVLAPGNAVRQASETGGLPPFQAVLASIRQAVMDFPLFFNPTLLLAVLFAAVILLRLLPHTDFRFQHPLPVQLLIFLLYASQHAPHLYAVGTAGPGRMQNIFYFSFLWMIFFSVFYWIGFLAHRAWFQQPRTAVRYPVAAMLMVLLVISGAVQCLHRDAVSAEALAEVLDGSAQIFDAEQNQRVAQYLDPAVQDLRFPPLTASPQLLFHIDLSTRTDDWANIAIASFYEKNTVCLEP